MIGFAQLTGNKPAFLIKDDYRETGSKNGFSGRVVRFAIVKCNFFCNLPILIYGKTKPLKHNSLNHL